MPSNHSIIKEFLKRSQLSYDDHQVDVTLHYMELLFNKNKPDEYEPSLDDFAEYLRVIYPEHVLYYKAYLHPLLSEVIVYLMVERLQNKDLGATIRQIHALCYQAQERLKSGLVEDETHAVNYMIKIFQSGEWMEPSEFGATFPEYKKKFKKVHPDKEDKE